MSRLGDAYDEIEKTVEEKEGQRRPSPARAHASPDMLFPLSYPACPFHSSVSSSYVDNVLRTKDTHGTKTRHLNSLDFFYSAFCSISNICDFLDLHLS